MEVTLLGMVTEVRPEQPEKVELSMDVTLLGMVIEVRLEQPEKASLLIKRVPSLIEHDVIVLSTASTRYVSAYRLLFTTGKLVQPLKALYPMEVTLLGIVIEVRLEQPEKALLSILITSSPIITSLIDFIFANHDPISRL